MRGDINEHFTDFMSDSPAPPGLSRGALVLAAATVVNLPFGTVYAFSVFLKPMEALLGIGRAEMALVFSMASICLTVGMLVGPALYRRFAPVPLLLVCGAVSACGLGWLPSLRASSICCWAMACCLAWGAGLPS